VKLHGIKNCGSVKKAMVFLNNAGIEYEFVDFKKSPATIEQITYWANKVGIDKLLNRKGTTYKKLGLSDMQLDDVQKIKWMAQENSLIKRPVIEYDNNVLVGFDESVYQITFNS